MHASATNRGRIRTEGYGPIGSNTINAGTNTGTGLPLPWLNSEALPCAQQAGG